MLLGLGVAEQWYRAVLEVVDEGASVTDVARRHGWRGRRCTSWLRWYVNDGGLTLWVLDVSAEALRQLAARRPDQAARLRHADFLGFEPDGGLAYVIDIQVFQHGRHADVQAYFARARALLPPGGLLFLRMNSASTEIYHAHEVVERNAQGGFTLEYRDGPKRGLAVHFSTRAELAALAEDGFRGVTEPREDVIRRAPPRHGSWAQWEAVYERR